MFNYDWFHSGGLDRLVNEARKRCTARKFPDQNPGINSSDEVSKYHDAIESRLIVYMKDGLQYEIKDIADVGTSTALTFECVPVDENYRVGSIVIVTPFEDIARVEVFAVQHDEKPQETFKIPGFRSGTETGQT